MPALEIEVQGPVDRSPAAGAAEPEFIIGGHSHIFALGAPTGYKGPIGLSPIAVDGRSGYFLMDEKIDRTAEYWDALVSHAKGRKILILFRGNQHRTAFMFAPDPLFDFVDVAGPHREPFVGAVVVPRRLVKARFVPTIRPVLPTTLRRLKEAGAASIVVMGTPAPWSKAEDLRSGFARVAAERNIDIMTVQLTPVSILQKIWRLIQEILEEVAREADVTFLPVLSESVDANGFLAERFFDKRDKSHANKEYGRLMLQAALRMA
jgi:hypothetical protein